MAISELVMRLNKIAEQHGDLNVSWDDSQPNGIQRAQPVMKVIVGESLSVTGKFVILGR